MVPKDGWLLSSGDRGSHHCWGWTVGLRVLPCLIPLLGPVLTAWVYHRFVSAETSCSSPLVPGEFHGSSFSLEFSCLSLRKWTRRDNSVVGQKAREQRDGLKLDGRGTEALKMFLGQWCPSLIYERRHYQQEPDGSLTGSGLVSRSFCRTSELHSHFYFSRHNCWSC